MGHKHDRDAVQPTSPLNKPADPPVPITQENIDQAFASSIAAGELPPDSEAMKAGHALLGRGVRVNIARMQTVILSNYDLVTDTYWGKIINANRGEGPAPFQDGEYVPGLRRYPYAARPDYAFQFVLPGEDESVLVNIAHGNLRQPE